MTKTLTARRATPKEYLYQFGLLNGRFQLIHDGHIANASAMFDKVEHGVINIGSANQSPDIRNPLTFEQRKAIWTEALTNHLNIPADRFTIIGQEDLGNPVRWASQVEESVARIIRERGLDPDETDVAIFGHRKDATSFYLDDFPRYPLEHVEAVEDLSSTQLRDQLFHIAGSAHAQEWLETRVPTWNVPVLREFMASATFEKLLIEQHKADDTAKAWEGTPYPVIFNTADAVVVQGNRILLSQRASYPGKDLWALPGTFLGYRETALDAAIRGATEKVGLDASRNQMRQAFVDTFVQDDPYRSTRGRTISIVSIFRFKPVPKGRTAEERRRSMSLPRVRGLSTGTSAWLTPDEIHAMRSSIFEDHAIIIDKALERLGIR